MFTSKSAQYTDVKNQNISPLVGLDSLYYEYATYNSTPGAQTNYVITREAVYKHMPVQLFNSSAVTPYKFDTSTSNNVAPENLENTQKITAIPNQEIDILGLSQVSTFLVEQTNIPLHGVEANRRMNLSDILYNYNSKYDISEYFNEFNFNISRSHMRRNASILTYSTNFNTSIEEMDISVKFKKVESDIAAIGEILSDIKLNIDSQLDGYSNTIYNNSSLKTLSSANELEVNKTYTMIYDSYSNKFLITLLAINSSQFSPIVSTQKIEGDTYFADSSVDKWEVKYDFENNVITYMKDEYGNEAPYDFKNIISPRTSYLFNSYIRMVGQNGDYSLTGGCKNNVVNSTSPTVELQQDTEFAIIGCYNNYIGYDSSNIYVIGSNNTIMNNTWDASIYGHDNYVGNNNTGILITSNNNTIKDNNSSINIDSSAVNNIIENSNSQITLKVSSNTKIYNNCTSIYSNNSNNNTFFGNNSYIQIDNDPTKWPYAYKTRPLAPPIKIADPIGENIFYFNVAGTTTNPIKLTNTNNIQIYSEIQPGKPYDYSDAYSFIFNGDVSSNLTNDVDYGIASHISNDILLFNGDDSTATYYAENNEWLIDSSKPSKFYITTLDSSNPITSNIGDVTIKPNIVMWSITNTYSNNTHYINIDPNNKIATVNVDLLYDNIVLLPNNLYKDTTPSNMPPLFGVDKSAFCYTFRSTQYPRIKYALNKYSIWDGWYNMNQGINIPSLNIWNASDKFPNVYISSNLFGCAQYTYADPDFPITTITSQGIIPLTNATGDVTFHLYGNAVKDISKIIYSKNDGTTITGNVVHEFTVGDSSLVRFKTESKPNINGGAAYNTELTVSSNINSTTETLNITLSYDLIDRVGAHRYLGYSGNHVLPYQIEQPNKLENYPKLTFKTNKGKILDSSVLLDIGTCFGEISFEVRWAFLPPPFRPDEQHDLHIQEYYMLPTYTFSHFEYDDKGDATYFVFAATSFNRDQNYIDDFSLVPTMGYDFYNVPLYSRLNTTPYLQLNQDLTDATKLAYLYIPISELTSVRCDNSSSQTYIHNYDKDNYLQDNPDSSNGILRLQYYVDVDNWSDGDAPDINEYLMKVYYRTGRGDEHPLDYVLNFNCKQLYRRQFAPEVPEEVRPV